MSNNRTTTTDTAAQGGGPTIATASAATPSQHLGHVLKDSGVETLLSTQGFAVIDNAFGAEWCNTIKEEMQILESEQFFAASKNKLSALTNPEGYVLDKHDIFELDMVFEGKVVCKPEAWLLAENLAFLYKNEMTRLVELLNEAYPHLELTQLDHMKLQINHGNGGCFPMHFDTHSDTQRSQRHLTAVLYLNEDWTPSWGGHVRLYPLPYATEDVAPINDRLVLFCSHSMLHRVMPSWGPRYCFSLWFASKTSSPFPTQLRSGGPLTGALEGAEEVLKFLFEKDKRRLLSKILYASEWDASVREAFGDLPEVQDSLDLHWKEVRRLEDKFNPEVIRLLKECLPLVDTARIATTTTKTTKHEN